MVSDRWCGRLGVCACGSASGSARLRMQPHAHLLSPCAVALPAVTIHTTVRLAQPVFRRLGRFTRFGPSVAGLAVVPLLPLLWDRPVELALHWAATQARKFVAGSQ